MNAKKRAGDPLIRKSHAKATKPFSLLIRKQKGQTAGYKKIRWDTMTMACTATGYMGSC